MVIEHVVSEVMEIDMRYVNRCKKQIRIPAEIVKRFKADMEELQLHESGYFLALAGLMVDKWEFTEKAKKIESADNRSTITIYIEEICFSDLAKLMEIDWKDFTAISRFIYHNMGRLEKGDIVDFLKRYKLYANYYQGE